MKPTTITPNNDIHEIVAYLNTLLADEYALYTKVRNADWNVNGANFNQLHHIFEKQYQALDIMIDDIARLVRTFGHFAFGSLKDFLRVTHMDEENHDFSNPELINRFTGLIKLK